MRGSFCLCGHFGRVGIFLDFGSFDAHGVCLSSVVFGIEMGEEIGRGKDWGV